MTMVFRRALLAVLICVAAWAWMASAGSAAHPRAHVDHGDAVVSRADDPADQDGSQRQWTARLESTATLTPSVWRTQPHQAVTAGNPAGDSGHASHGAHAPPRGSAHAPRHLRSIPLLI